MLLIPILAFLFASALVAAAAFAFAPANGSALEQRLGEVTGTRTKTSESDGAYGKAFVSALKRIGNAAPKSPSEMGKLQQKLVHAGYRSREALVIFFGDRKSTRLNSSH